MRIIDGSMAPSISPVKMAVNLLLRGSNFICKGSFIYKTGDDLVVRMGLILQRLAQNVTAEGIKKNAARWLAAFLSGLTR